MSSSPRVVLTGGGTGGHIYPALAIAEALRIAYPQSTIHYLGGTSGPEAAIVPAQGLPFTALTTRKVRRLASPDTLFAALALVRGYAQARRHLRAFRPQAVIGTGGYVAAAAGLAAVRLGIPLTIVAPDAVPGRTNLLLSRWARRVCVWFEESASAYPRSTAVITGVPIASRFSADGLSRDDARRILGLQPTAFTLLVLGGSQGARFLNDLIVSSAPALIGRGIQILHQTGARNLDAVRAASAGLPEDLYHLRPYLGPREMAAAYRSADLAVCRCGVATLAEAAACAVPLIMVPLPTAYADHQTANARCMERAGAGILAPQAELTPELLTEHVAALQADADRLAAHRNGSSRMGRKEAAAAVARVAMEAAGIVWPEDETRARVDSAAKPPV